jgi:serine O-acetyltransferase
MIRTKADLKYSLQYNRKAQGLPERMSIMRWIKNIFMPSSIWNFTSALRHCEYYSNNHCAMNLLGVIYKFRHLSLSQKLGLNIPMNVFGPGLKIDHLGGIIVNENFRCSIRPYTVIGNKQDGKNDQVPLIDDNVTI